MKPALARHFPAEVFMGMAVVGLGLLGVGALYLITGDVSVLSGFSLGASSIALFARVGGGIYTKAADVGADLVGKVEAGIPEVIPATRLLSQIMLVITLVTLQVWGLTCLSLMLVP